MKKKMLVIGLDGGSFDILHSVFSRGYMPFLENFFQDSLKSTLWSTFPPVTCPAWPSLLTGLNPSHHEIYSFMKPLNKHLRRNPYSISQIKGVSLWRVLGECGIRYNFVNVPMTYPPPKGKGIVVSGLLTPSSNSEFVYPAHLKQTILKKIGKIFFDIPWHHYGPKKIHQLIKKLLLQIEQIEKLSELLIRQNEVDFFMVVFMTTAFIFHCLLPYFYDKHPLYSHYQDDSLEKEILDIFRRLDGAIEKVINLFRKKYPDSLILFVSDHGFGISPKAFNVNLWLQKEGFLSVKPPGLESNVMVKALKRHLGKYGLLDSSRQVLTKMLGKEISLPELIYAGIDWEKTKAYAGIDTELGIYINLKNRDPFGIVEEGEQYESVRKELIERLIAFSKQNGNIFESVVTREEVLGEKSKIAAPDIIFKPKNYEFQNTNNLNAKEIIEDIEWGDGWHREEGILLANGGSISNTEQIKGKCNLIDIFPTVLSYYNIKFNGNLDGRIIDELAPQDSSPPIIFKSGELLEDGKGYSAEEEMKITEKLKNLGYID